MCVLAPSPTCRSPSAGADSPVSPARGPLGRPLHPPPSPQPLWSAPAPPHHKTCLCGKPPAPALTTLIGAEGSHAGCRAPPGPSRGQACGHVAPLSSGGSSEAGQPEGPCVHAGEAPAVSALRGSALPAPESDGPDPVVSPCIGGRGVVVGAAVRSGPGLSPAQSQQPPPLPAASSPAQEAPRVRWVWVGSGSAAPSPPRGPPPTPGSASPATSPPATARSPRAAAPRPSPAPSSLTRRRRRRRRRRTRTLFRVRPVGRPLWTREACGAAGGGRALSLPLARGGACLSGTLQLGPSFLVPCLQGVPVSPFDPPGLIRLSLGVPSGVGTTSLLWQGLQGGGPWPRAPTRPSSPLPAPS